MTKTLLNIQSSTSALPDLSDAFAHFEVLKARLKAAPNDSGLGREFRAAAKQINTGAAFIQLTPDTDPALLAQLCQDEKVHPVSFEAYMQTRIARPGHNKGAFARAALDKNGPRGLSAMYVLYDRIACGADGSIPLAHLRGDIHAVKNAPPVSCAFSPNILYPYTVTSKFMGAGNYQAAQTRAAHVGLAMVTMSPVRECKVGRDMALPEPDRIRAVADYLAGREGYSAMDPVAFFHMSNGAYAGRVQFNPADTLDTLAINYPYSADDGVIASNQRTFKAGYVPMARELYEYVSPALKNRVAPVDAPLVLPAAARAQNYNDPAP